MDAFYFYITIFFNYMKKITQYILEGLFDRFKKKINAPDQKIEPKKEEPKQEETKEISKEEASTKTNENEFDVRYSNIDGFTKEEFDKTPTFDTTISGISYNIEPTFSYTWGVIYHDEYNDYDDNAWVIMDKDKFELGHISRKDKRKFLNWKKEHKRIPYIGIIYKWIDREYNEVKVGAYITCLRSYEGENAQEDFSKLLINTFNYYQRYMKDQFNRFKREMEEVEKEREELKKKYNIK